MSYSFVQTSDVIGIDKDKEIIVKLIMHPCDGDQKACVIPIAGLQVLGRLHLLNWCSTMKKWSAIFT